MNFVADFRALEHYLGYLAALAEDVDAVGGIVDTYTLQVVVNGGGVVGLYATYACSGGGAYSFAVVHEGLAVVFVNQLPIRYGKHALIIEGAYNRSNSFNIGVVVVVVADCASAEGQFVGIVVSRLVELGTNHLVEGQSLLFCVKYGFEILGVGEQALYNNVVASGCFDGYGTAHLRHCPAIHVLGAEAGEYLCVLIHLTGVALLFADVLHGEGAGGAADAHEEGH